MTTTYSWNGPGTGGDWNNTANWLLNGATTTGIPGITNYADYVQFNSAAVVTIDGTFAQGIGELDINAAVSFIGSNSFSGINGLVIGTGAALTTGAGIILSVSGALTVGANAALTVDGTAKVSNLITIDAGGTVTIAAGGDLATSTGVNVTGTATITGAGTLNTQSNSVTVAAGATLTVSGVTLSAPGIQGGGTVLLANGADFQVTGNTTSGGSVVAFASGSNSTITLEISYSPNLTINNFGAGDVISSSGQLYLFNEGGTYYLSNSTGYDSKFAVVTLASNVTFTPDSGQSYETLPSSGTGGYTICYCAGTLIATPNGEVAVETLRAGDLVLTMDGQALPVRWLGESRVARRFADAMRDYPIRIAAGALGAGLPARALRVSPDHALFLDGLLVQAGALVNGTTIWRETQIPALFSYYHVELARHELLLAEGMPAESFVDNIDRRHFSNFDERVTPATPVAEMAYPRVKSARQLPAALRARLMGAGAAAA
ncbi:Hint domain-containing protein [Acidocella sp.]|uniref:Hint domain-containing protein n=1 Tax=Acidocella sp. TaxID=50710 RepID=UPI00261122CD|nr:Hint domain-containing protein [Acidocella sp.]